MANLYHIPALPTPGETTLSGDIAHHLLRVLRLRPGDRVTLADGLGRTATATICSANRQELVAAIAEPEIHPAIQPRVTIAFACPRPARTDWLIEHGTEVGVATFQPLWTNRSRPQSMRSDRWRKIAMAAAGQCARAHLPEINKPLELDDFFEQSLPACRLLADASGAPMRMAEGEADAVVLIGPEGGLTAEEASTARKHGFTPSSVGPHILRTETAALVSAAVLLQAARINAGT